MDFGLGSIIEKFEEYYGKSITKYLLAILAAVIIFTFLRVILDTADQILATIIEIQTTLESENGLPLLFAALKAFGTSLIVSGTIFMIAYFFLTRGIYKKNREIDERIESIITKNDRVEESKKYAEESLKFAEESLKFAMETLEKAEETLEISMETLRRAEKIVEKEEKKYSED